MDTINERFLTIRKEKKLSQEAIGKILHISGAAYSRIENGINNPSAQTLSLLCSELSVNKDWLRTGEGSMFCENDSSTLARLASEYHLDNFSQTVLASFLSLNEKSREAVLTFVKEIVVNVINDNHNEIRPHLMDEPAHAAPAKTLEEEAVEEAEAYRQEYLQAKKRQTSLASDSGNKRIG